MSGKLLVINQNPASIFVVLVVSLAYATHLCAQTPLDEQPPTLQTPADGTPQTELPEFVEITAEPAADKKIREALKGDQSTPVPGGVLGDVIGIIRKQGSVLDGSSLDPRLEASEARATRGSRLTSDETSVSYVQTAEELLRAARMLESHAKQAARRGEILPRETHPDVLSMQELVRQMRIHATRLLATEFPQAIDE